MEIEAIEVFETLKSVNPDFMHTMHTYFKKVSHSARRNLVVKKIKKRLRTLGPSIWNSVLKDVKGPNFSSGITEFIKHFYDLNANARSANTSVNHITILELYTPSRICLSESLIPNVNKRSIERHETVMF